MAESSVKLNPAEEASERAMALVFKCIDQGRSFLLEAGAGAGKTYSLVQSLRYIIDKRGTDLLRNNQQVACITYTNVASDEIKSRIDGHPAILTSTIHAFAWSVIKGFQPFLREHVGKLSKWPEKLEEIGGIGSRAVGYDLGHRRAKKGEDAIYLSHDDVISLMVALIEAPKFRQLLMARFPIILIDEYQDTNTELARSLGNHFLAGTAGPLLGFFGDHWQKIYGDGCGKLQFKNLEEIGKKANFRSCSVIVDCLNRIRPELPQFPKDPDALGSVAIYHTNGWQGTRKTGQHWAGDLPTEAARSFFKVVQTQLSGLGWTFSPSNTKVLMLTNKALASEQGYETVTSTFSYSDSYIKKEDPYISFLVDTVEPMSNAYLQKKFGEMISILGGKAPNIRGSSDKKNWAIELDALMELRASQKSTIGEVIDFCKKAQRPTLPDSIEKREAKLLATAETDEDREDKELIEKIRLIPYREITALAQFIDDKTPFSTKHGVKGAEFDDVFAVFGRGWNQYDFNSMLEMAGSQIPAGREEFFERNRNLFYVVCSRPRNRLALLFTQKLSDRALATLGNWFGQGNIHSLG